MTRRAWLALLGGGLILTLAMGVRQTFGLLLSPMSVELGISREAFGLALAIQNLLWGAAQPFAGLLADRFGTGRAILAGTLAYASGVALMAGAGDALDLMLGAGIMVGLGLSGVSFAVVLGAVGKAVPDETRSMALGIAAAGGSFGQFVMAPIGQTLISAQGWSGALMAMAVLSLAMAPLSLLLAGPGAKPHPTAGRDLGRLSLGIGEALGEAARYPSFWYLILGFFVCGFQVVFIGVHLPAYLNDLGFSPAVGATALALIGFFNIIGTYGCGALGARFSKKSLLAVLYALRSGVIVVFLLAPKTEAVVMIFAAAIGVLWLGTVPLTSGLVAQIFGVQYLSMLFGIAFFSHQIGSFLGVWLGGWVFDSTGSYDAIWIASIALGLLAALVNLPIIERPLRPEVVGEAAPLSR